MVSDEYVYVTNYIILYDIRSTQNYNYLADVTDEYILIT